jgi:hypothetical protein
MPLSRKSGQDRDQGEIGGPDQRNPGEDPVDVLGRALARADAGNEAPVLAHVLGEIAGVEDDRDVEVAEEDDPDDVEQVVQRLPPRQLIGDLLQPRRLEHLRRGGRKRHQRAREDHRNDACGVDPQRQVGALPAVDLSPDHTLGVLHRNPPLRPLHVDDEGDDEHHEDDRGSRCR